MPNNPCREATAADLEAILPLVAEFCGHFEYRFSAAGARASLGTLLSDPKLGRLFAIETSGTVIGYMVLAFSFSLEFGGRTAFIDEFFVGPGGRGRGLGGQALDFVSEYCRGLGINAILLEAEENNPRASALYERSGYESFGRRLLTKVLNTRAGYKASLRSE
jgi:GNAT superfamily N-acetyltransferase